MNKTGDLALSVKAVGTLENAQFENSKATLLSDSGSDSGDSDFSIDDHHLPWEVTEKLLLQENSDIELVQSRGVSTMSLWPPARSGTTRRGGRGTNVLGTSSSLYSMIIPEPAPHTVFAAQQIAENEKEYERMRVRLTQLKYRAKAKEKKGSATTAGHGHGLNQYGSGVRHIAVRKLPHNIDRHRTYRIGMTLAKGSGMSLLPKTRVQRRLPSRTVSAPMNLGNTMSMTRFKYSVRERNVLIKPLALSAQHLQSNSVLPEDTDAEEIIETTPKQQRPRTAPLRRSPQSKTRQRPASSRRATAEDDALAIGNVFAASTEIKKGLLRLSQTPMSLMSSSSFGSLPDSEKVSLDRYWNANELSVSSPLPSMYTQTGLKPWAPEGDSRLTPNNSHKKRRNYSPSTTPNTKTKTKANIKTKTKTKTKTKKTATSPTETTQIPRTPTSKQLKLKRKPSPSPSKKRNIPVNTALQDLNHIDRETSDQGLYNQKYNNHVEIEVERKTIPAIVVEIPDNTMARTESMQNTAESTTMMMATAATTAAAAATTTTMPTMIHSQLTDTISSWNNAANPNDSIGLYNTTTEGSCHVVFDQTLTHPDHDYLNPNVPERDPTITLTSPGRLPKTILKRVRDSIFVPQNQLMEDRKNKTRIVVGAHSKKPPKINAQGSHFVHQATNLAKKAADERIMRSIEIAKEKKRVKQQRRARKKFQNKSTSKLGTKSRPTTAGSTATGTSRPTTAGSRNNKSKTAAQSAKMPKGTKPPPEGWQEHLDPVSGRTFYVHLTTKKTSWRYPNNWSMQKTHPKMYKSKTSKFSPRPGKKMVQQDWREYCPPPVSDKMPWE